jgi:hypothetical protein
MYWPFKTTVKLIADDAREPRVKYLDSANSSFATKCELQRRFISQDVFGYAIEKVAAATKQEAAMFKLPSGCVQLFGLVAVFKRRRTVLGG